MSSLDPAFDHLATDLRDAGDPERAPQMEAYMKDRFQFLGVGAPDRKRLQRPFLAAAKNASIEEVLTAVERCWAEADREFHYVGADLLRAQAKRLDPEHLAAVRRLIVTHSWWDTVDSLASHSVGTMVERHPALAEQMDTWIDDDNLWVARSALLHQLRRKDSADQDRLFDYALRRAGDTEFFIRKAIGWALRTHARVAPDAVRSFVSKHEDEFSGLTKREALKHL